MSERKPDLPADVVVNRRRHSRTMPPVRELCSRSAAFPKSSSSNTKVVARFRPKSEFELQTEEDKPELYRFPNEESVVIENKESEIIRFDRIFPPCTSQIDVFEAVGRPVIEDVLEGYNGTVFAYGQTGSGKTYSMMGSEVFDEERCGIIPRAASLIFSVVSSSDSDVEFTFRCSMLEIYKETLKDLLGAEAVDLRIKEDPRKGIYVQGLTEVFVTAEEEMLEVISIGEQMRTVASTKCNKVSSRSHQLFILEVKQHFSNDSEKRGILNLVDLAGSEKVNHSGVTGEKLQEAKKINLSLSALGNVIHALVSGCEHIPYRDSKLTRLLQESLGGNYKTTLLVALSPAYRHVEETLNSIKFAQRVKHLKNTVSVNIKKSPEAYQKIIDELNEEIASLRRSLQGGTLLRAVSSPMMGFEEERCELEKRLNAEEAQKLRYKLEESQKKEQELTLSKSELTERVSDLEVELDALRRKLIKEKERGTEYYTLYHRSMQLINKDSNDLVYLRKQNESQSEQIKSLTAKLEKLDVQFSKALEELSHAGAQSTIVEFADVSDVLSSSSSDDLSVTDESERLPIPESMVAAGRGGSHSYARNVKTALEANSILSSDVTIHQLKNQLLQAHVANVNLTRIFKLAEWRTELLVHKYKLKRLHVKKLSEQVKGLEEMITHITEAYRSLSSCYEKVCHEGNMSVLRRSMAADNSFSRIRFSRSVHGAGQRFTSLRGRRRANTITQGKESVSCESSHMAVSPPSFLDRHAADPGDSQESFGVLKSRQCEASLHMQVMQNDQLEAKLEQARFEAMRNKEKLEQVCQQREHELKAEYDRWKAHLEEYKFLTESELEKKQTQLLKMNEVLSSWIHRFLALQDDSHGPLSEDRGHHHRRTRSGLPSEAPSLELKALCRVTMEVMQASKDMMGSFRFSSSPVLTGRSTTCRSGITTPTVYEMD